MSNEYRIKTKISYNDILLDRLDEFNDWYKINNIGNEYIVIEVKRWKPTRSLSSNAYLHAIIGEIASATGMDRELIKQGIKEQYGAKMAYNGRLVCKPSHLMDTEEFSELIRGAEIEATEAGVDLRKVRDV